MDHPVNARVPANFRPLHIPDLKFEEHILFGPNSYLASSGFRCISRKHVFLLVIFIFISSPALSSDFTMVFDSSEKEGAVLVMPDGALSQDLLFHRKTLAKYISANARMWYEYIVKCGLTIHDGDLHVICGVDKATSWAIATFNTDDEELPTQLKFVADDQPGASESRAYRWEILGRGYGRVGPRQDEMVDLEATGRSRNQCLFVRTVQTAIWQ